MVAVGAVEDKKPTVVFNVDRCVAVVIAGRPERIGEQRVDNAVKVSPGLPTAVGADIGIVGAIRRVLVVLGLAACGGAQTPACKVFAVPPSGNPARREAAQHHPAEGRYRSNNTPRALIDWMYLALLYSLQAAGAIPQARWEIDVSSWCLSS